MLKTRMLIRTFMLAGLCTFSFCGIAVPTFAQVGDAKHHFMINNVPLTADELRAAFQGQTHEGFYRFERETLPTHAFTETTFKDGRVKHVQGDETLYGRWEIMGSQICFSYDDVWFNHLCFDMYRIGNCYYHYLMTEGKRPIRVWTAQSSLKGERPNCEPGIS